MKALPVRSVWPAVLLLVFMFLFFLAFFFCLFLVFFGCTPSAVRALVAVDFYLITAPNFRHFKRWRHKIIASAENIKKKPARNGSWLKLGAGLVWELLLAPILQLQARLSFSFLQPLMLPLPLPLLPIVIEFCVCRQSGKQARLDLAERCRVEAATKRNQFQAKFSLNASATRSWWRLLPACLPAWQTVARGVPLCDLLYARIESSRVESSRVGWVGRVEYRAKCWLLTVAYCCLFGCWLKLCLLWNSINLNLLHWRDVISFFFPLPSACLPAPIHLQFSLLSVLTDDCVLW